MSLADEILQKLAFQRGVLTLLRDAGRFGPNIDRAIEDVDQMIEGLVGLQSR